MQRYYKPFPPGLGHIKVPTSSRGSAEAALALYSACRVPTEWMHRAAGVCVRLFGARALPGRSAPWLPPMGTEVWEELIARWKRDLGPFDEYAVGERAQARRSGFSLLLLSSGRPRAFLKVRQDGADGMRRESGVTRLAWEARPRSFAVPEPLGVGGVLGWDYFAMASILEARHRAPRNPPLSAVVAEIADALESLPRDPHIPSHWRPMHGDLTPWNLREVPAGGLVLFDWEDAAWAPPLADMVMYRATDAAVRKIYRAVPHGDEAAKYWLSIVAQRNDGTVRGQNLQQSLRRALLSMQAGGETATPVAVSGGASSIV